MIPKLGEVWMVDMGIAGKVRPAVIVLDDAVTVERSIIIHIPITSQNRGTALEVPLGHLRFLTGDSVAFS
jgi:mRNA interferase MazF